MTGGKLPEGKTCSDCVHSERCSWLIGIKGTETQCDWLPSRFFERKKIIQEGSRK